MISLKTPPLGQFIRVVVGVIATTYATVNLTTYVPYLSSPYVMEDDQRQHLLPACALAHPESFREGFLTNYARSYLPPGYLALTRIASFLGNPLLCCKILGIALLILTYITAFAVGRSIAGTTCGFLTMMLVVHSGTIESSTFSGLFRSFAFPLAMTFMFGLSTQRYWIVFVALVMGSLFYPPIFLVCGLTLFLFVVSQARTFLRERRRLLVSCAVAGLMGIAIVGISVQRTASYGKPFTKQEASQMPEWGKRTGRLREFPWPSTGETIQRFMSDALEANSWGLKIFPGLVQTADDEYHNVLSMVWVGLFGLAAMPLENSNN